jgi:ubiquinone/menaquinone biosynthesis C-methylase UbiE
MNKDSEQLDRVISQFTAQSKRFHDPQFPLSGKDVLDWAVDSMPLDRSFRVIDVAAGTGLLALAVSPFVQSVVAVDITQAMLDEGVRSAKAKGIQNAAFRLGNAYDLGETAAYDLAMSRIAFHHMDTPELVLGQMIEAVRPGGHVVVFDLLSPDEAELQEPYNRFERLRDDSHTVALTEGAFKSMFEATDLLDIVLSRRLVVNDLEAWMGMTNTPEANKSIIRDAMNDEIRGGEKTGFYPFVEDGAVKFAHRWLRIMGKRPV